MMPVVTNDLSKRNMALPGVALSWTERDGLLDGNKGIVSCVDRIG